jgi:eukaryotic-like serine/threonine-protein kinase
VVELDTRVLGREHRYTLIDMRGLARVYQHQGKYPEAEATLNRVLETQRRVIGPDKPETLTTVSSLGTVKFYEGDYAGAEQLFNQALEGDRRVLGNEHPGTLSSLVWLGRARLKERKYLQAEANFREALSTYERTSPDAWQRYSCQNLLGASLVGERRFGEAEPLLLAAYETMMERRDKIPAASQPEIESAGAEILSMYEEWPKTGKAAEWQSKLRARIATPKRE